MYYGSFTLLENQGGQGILGFYLIIASNSLKFSSSSKKWSWNLSFSWEISNAGKTSKHLLAKEEKEKYDTDVLEFLVHWNPGLDTGDRLVSIYWLCEFAKLKFDI